MNNKDATEQLEGLLLQIKDSDVNMRENARVFDDFIETANSASQSKGLVTEGSPVSFYLQNLQSTRSKEVERAKVRSERASKTGTSKKRWAEYYEAEKHALFHMKKDMRQFIKAFKEAHIQHSHN